MSFIPEWIGELAAIDEHDLRNMMRNAPAPVRRRFFEEWFWQAHGGQREPSGDWRVWMMMAGRGFGKTRAGAEWVSARAREWPGARIALAGANLDDVAKVMIEGESGLIAVARSGEKVRWSPTKATVDFASGAQGFAYSGERPDKLRGPQHHFAWCNELAKWAHGGVGYVLADDSVRGLSPEGWAAAVCAAADRWRADRVVAEANQCGLMVESVLRAVEQDLPLKLRHATEAKGKRAEPVAALFERGRARFAGSFPELEDELVGLMPGGAYAGPGRSPDRADAMVWALGELMLGRRGSPRVRGI